MNPDAYQNHSRRSDEQENLQIVNSHATNDHWILFDWGDTLMRDIPGFQGPMVNWPRIEVVEGAVETLGELKKYFPTALATNAVESNEDLIWAALKRANLDEFIDRVFCYQVLKVRKPSIEFYTAILKNIQVPAENVLMVGDSQDADVQGALRAGLHAVWFNEKDAVEIVDSRVHTIHFLRELIPLVNEYFAR